MQRNLECLKIQRFLGSCGTDRRAGVGVAAALAVPGDGEGLVAGVVVDGVAVVAGVEGAAGVEGVAGVKGVEGVEGA